jgi:serine/threonine protein kinase
MELKWFLGRKQRQVIVKLYGRKKLGQWADYLTLAIKMAQVVRRLHFRGLCHSDLSFRNFLVDPQTEQLILIDCDGLVVPGFLPANVLGTPQCMAPELAAQLLPNSPQAIPSTQTDLHALATLIYWMLMWRHPLIGPKVHDPDPFVDEALALGKNALFIEHSVDTSNRPDNIAIDYTKLLTPAVQHLVERAFVDGLHQPAKRPSAAEWERALHRMRDALVYCENKDCPLGTFVLSSSNQPTCLCGTPITRTPCLPILHFYRPRHGRVGHFQNDRDYFLVGQNKRHLYIWHADPTQSPGPNVDDTPKAILRYNGRWEKWYFKNSALPDVRLLTPNRSDIAIPPGTQTELVDGARLLLGPPDRCRLAYVRMMRMDNKQ